MSPFKNVFSFCSPEPFYLSGNKHIFRLFLVCLLPDLSPIFYSPPSFSTIECMPMPHRSQHRSDLIRGLLASAAYLSPPFPDCFRLPLPLLHASVIPHRLCLSAFGCAALRAWKFLPFSLDKTFLTLQGSPLWGSSKATFHSHFYASLSLGLAEWVSLCYAPLFMLLSVQCQMRVSASRPTSPEHRVVLVI